MTNTKYLNKKLNPTQLNILADNGYVIFDDFLAPDFYQALRHEATHLLGYRDASITSGKMLNIRSDQICWIEESQPLGYQYLTLLNDFIPMLNRFFYTGIKRTEAHYARYDAGKFYAKHVDNPAGKNHRVFSGVFYLNTDWTADDGGMLLIDAQPKTMSILPSSNRLVLFNSALAHEVKPAKRPRFSIATWYRQDMPI